MTQSASRPCVRMLAAAPVLLLSAAMFAFALFYKPSVAHSIPAFARQTGQECSACHVGSFGPQLTRYGRDFKLNGYVWGSASNPLKGLSAMAFGGIEHTGEDLRRGTELTGVQERFHTNNNPTLDQFSLFYGGRLLSNVGMLAQATYSNPKESFAWDNTDIRFADNATLAGESLVYGVSLNNNPSVQDIWQTTPAWRFPYLTSALAPTPDASPYISSLGGRVAGLGAYGMWNDLVYGELSGYATLPNHTQLTLGEKNAAQNDYLSGVAPYWRLALQQDFGQHYVSVGTYGIAASRYPDNVRDFGTDTLLDYAADATYQFTSGDGRHSVSVYGSALHERQTLNATFAAGNSANLTDDLNDLRANIAYYYDNKYGVTLGRFSTTGSADATLYPDASHRPDSTGWIVQCDFTPLGTADSLGWPYLNARFFVQYTAYNSFNGVGSNYDGTGRNASGNNTLFAGTWLAF
ncbi:MAG: cytochrome C [Pseudomonadota bacterium]|nr:cytochrome C [Pseudomonadota bacterium]MDE3038283.1 cytochrome C [Pseudomonadota bacterium]